MLDKEYLEKASWYKSVADAIRNKKGTTDPILRDDFASEIEGISGGGDTPYYDGTVIIENVGDLPYENGILKAGTYVFNETINLSNIGGEEIYTETPDGTPHTFYGFGHETNRNAWFFVCITEDVDAFLADPTNSDYGLFNDVLCIASTPYEDKEVTYFGMLGFNSRYTPAPLYFDGEVVIEGATCNGWSMPFVRYIYIPEDVTINSVSGAWLNSSLKAVSV